MTNKQKLPNSWILTTIGHAIHILDNKRKPINSKERQQRIESKKETELFPYYGATGQVGYIDDYLIDGDFVLLGEDGAPFLDLYKQKAYQVSGRIWVNNHAHILKAIGSNAFLCNYLNQIDYSAFVTGTTRLKLNQSAMKNIPYLLPPLNEQRRIVAKIEELFASLDTGVEALKKAKEQIKTYRQSVLQAAFEGKLTEEWREENVECRMQNVELGNEGDDVDIENLPAKELINRIKAERQQKYEDGLAQWKMDCETAKAEGRKKPAKPKKPKELPPLTGAEIADLPDLPDGWEWSKIGNILDDIKYGTSKKCSYNDTGTPVLRIPNIVDGRIDTTDLKYSNFTIDEKNNYSLKKNDILLIRSNGSISIVGKTALVPQHISNFLYAGYLIRLRYPISFFIPKFLNYSFNTILLRNQIELKAKSTSGVNNINSDELSSLIIPILSLSEQQQIVEEIEKRLIVADKLEQTIDDSLKRADLLRQGILKKAFEGRLVPQDPKDEPASVLLERIKAEKAEIEKKNKKLNKRKVKK